MSICNLAASCIRWVLLAAYLMALGLCYGASSEFNLEDLELESVPVAKMCQAASPEVVASGHWNQINSVSLANNRIERLKANEFTCVASALRILILSHNQLKEISSLAFEQLGMLQVLLLDNNQLESVPSIEALSPLKSLKHINLAHNRIGFLPSNSFGPSSSNLISLNLQANPLRSFAPDSLVHLVKLKTLTLSETKLSGSLQMVPFDGLNELRFYHLDRLANLTSVGENLCKGSPKLSSLVLKSNKLERVPQFADCQSLLQLDLSYNRIAGTLNENFTSQPNLIDLYLGHNQLESLGELAFQGLSHLQVLELNDNRLVHIRAGAFLPLRLSIQDLNLANNPHLTRIDSLGLERLTTFKCYGNPKLRSLPHLPSARNLALTYAYHCCDYLTSASSRSSSQLSSAHLDELPATSLLGQLLVSMMQKLGLRQLHQSAQQTITFPVEDEINQQQQQQQQQQHQELSNLSDLVLWPSGGELDNVRQKQQRRMTSNADFSQEMAPQSQLIDDSSMKSRDSGNNIARYAHTPSKISCLPKPSAFLPCEDLFDSWWLRLGIWLVFPLAFAGNILVIIVLGSVRQSSSTSALASIMWLSRSKRHIDVPRFLVINLAIADLMMALYLGILAFVDLSTMGEFRLFAIKWQYSSGCKLAGFLSVLSSELSVFILAIITLERNYAITNAVHLNRRLSLHKAMLIMFIGYAFALAMAIMPLNGISDYRKFSICLPLSTNINNDIHQDQTASTSSQIYIITLITINTFSFILLLGCYLRMYCAIRGSQAWNTNDLRIAKRMSVLVLTDFLCWMPIICVSIVSLFGRQLVDSEGLKVMAIFVLPLNSVANPFLYAITTKKFKRDLDTLVRRFRSVLNLIRCPCYCLANETTGSKFEKPVNVFGRHHNLNYHVAQKKRQQLYKSPNEVQNQKRRALAANDGQKLDCCCCCCCCDETNSMKLHHRNGHNATKAKRCKHLIVARPLNTANHLVTINRTSCSVNLAQQMNAKCPEYSVHHLASAGPEVDFRGVDAADSKQVAVQIKFEQHATSSADDHNQDALSIASSLINRTPNNHLLCSGFPNASRHEHNASCQTILVAGGCRKFASRAVTAENDDQVMTNPTIRSVSACGYQTHDNGVKQANGDRLVSCSCDTVPINRDPAANHQQPSRSINRLLFDPIAKAWSSVHISIGESNSEEQFGGEEDEEEDDGRHYDLVSDNYNNNGIDDRKESMTTDDIFTVGSPNARHLQLRINERRMSRSCDYIISEQQTTSNNEPTLATNTTSGDDDQKTLLSSTRIPLASSSFRNRCKRCRSWSPALLSKLEECIYRVRSRIPGLSSVKVEQSSHESVRASNLSDDEESADDNNNKSAQSKSTTGSRSQISLNVDVCDSKIEEPPTKITEGSNKIKHSTTIQRRRLRKKWSHKRKQMLRQPSANSDSFSIRTGGTVLTNMSVSFDSNSSIPDGSGVSKDVIDEA